MKTILCAARGAGVRGAPKGGAWPVTDARALIHNTSGRNRPSIDCDVPVLGAYECDGDDFTPSFQYPVIARAFLTHETIIALGACQLK